MNCFSLMVLYVVFACFCGCVGEKAMQCNDSGKGKDGEREKRNTRLTRHGRHRIEHSKHLGGLRFTLLSFL